jgi:hypothetical protein
MYSQPRRIWLAAAAALALPVLAGAASPGSPVAAQVRAARVVTAYVTISGAVTPINTATNKADKAIPTGGTTTMVITPNGKTLYAEGVPPGGPPRT